MDNSRLANFRDFLNRCSLMDIESKWCAYTWTNNRDGVALIKERLDRVLGNIEWRVTYSGAEVFALPAIGSDHCPLILSLFTEPQRRKRDFKFEAFWMDDEEYTTLVASSWHNHQSQNVGLLHKLQKIIEVLNAWSKRKFSNASRQITTLKRQMIECMNSIGEESSNQTMRRARGQIEKLWRQEEIY